MSASSGKTTTSAPSASAHCIPSRMRSALPVRSPTTFKHWTAATRGCPGRFLRRGHRTDARMRRACTALRPCVRGRAWRGSSACVEFARRTARPAYDRHVLALAEVADDDRALLDRGGPGGGVVSVAVVLGFLSQIVPRTVPRVAAAGCCRVAPRPLPLPFGDRDRLAPRSARSGLTSRPATSGAGCPLDQRVASQRERAVIVAMAISVIGRLRLPRSGSTA